MVSEAHLCSKDGEETRIARNRHPYNRRQFDDYYGQDSRFYWDEAEPAIPSSSDVPGMTTHQHAEPPPTATNTTATQPSEMDSFVDNGAYSMNPASTQVFHPGQRILPPQINDCHRRISQLEEMAEALAIELRNSIEGMHRLQQRVLVLERDKRKKDALFKQCPGPVRDGYRPCANSCGKEFRVNRNHPMELYCCSGCRNGRGHTDQCLTRSRSYGEA